MYSIARVLRPVFTKRAMYSIARVLCSANKDMSKQPCILIKKAVYSYQKSRVFNRKILCTANKDVSRWSTLSIEYMALLVHILSPKEPCQKSHTYVYVLPTKMCRGESAKWKPYLRGKVRGGKRKQNKNEPSIPPEKPCIPSADPQFLIWKSNSRGKVGGKGKRERERALYSKKPCIPSAEP